MNDFAPELKTGHADELRPAQSHLPLWGDLSFWGITLTQFLGAFNDNLFKQALLLLFVAVPTADGGTTDLQWLATFVFSAPFIMFSGYAGFLSDRYSKRPVIVLSKIAELLIMLGGAGSFLALAAWGMTTPVIVLLTTMLFCMGAQSAFFGPGKYGILPEVFRGPDLPRANGIILMTTFMAIIFGTALAGVMLQYLPVDLRWLVGVACSVIALVGILTSLWLRRPPAAFPGLPFEWSALAIPGDMLRLLRDDRPLLSAVTVSSFFWMAAAIVTMAINALGKDQLKLTDDKTSLMAAVISLGIAAGGVVAGKLSHNRFHVGVMRWGAIGMTICLALLALPDPTGARPHLLGFYGSLPTLVFLGAFTGMFAVPLQVFMQTRPPDKLKGRMIATQNLLNWIGILSSSLFYLAADRLNLALGLPKSVIFGTPAAVMLVIVVCYHPKDEPLQ